MTPNERLVEHARANRAKLLRRSGKLEQLVKDQYACIDVLMKGIGGIATSDSFLVLLNEVMMKAESLGAKRWKDRECKSKSTSSTSDRSCGRR